MVKIKTLKSKGGFTTTHYQCIKTHIISEKNPVKCKSL